MSVISLLTETALTKSTDQNSGNLINLYLVEDSDQGKYTEVAYPTPGNTLFSAGTSVLRAIFTEHGVTYGIDGNTFFSVSSNGTRTTLGTLNTSSGWAKIKGIANELFIADSSNGYYYNISGNSFNTIATGNNTVLSIAITAPGAGYSGATTVSFSGGGGTGATGTVTISGGQIIAVSITNTGKNYTSAPAVSFSDSGGGGGATATATIQAQTFPTAIQDIECQDEFGLVLFQNSQTWSASAISDLNTWPSLSFASTTGNQNYNQAIISVHRELYILGNQTSEVWDNLGSANFTFGRNTSVFIENGCVARSSVAKADNTFYFLSQSPTGAAMVMTLGQGYTPRKISNRAIDYQISTYATINDAIGITYQQEGHEFYVLTFPSANVTWAYDITTDKWHQRQSGANSWLANCFTYNYNKQLIGDRNTGNIYYLDMTNNTENGSPITRTIVSHPFYNAGMWVNVSRIQIDFDNTPGANLSNWNLYLSRDGGRNFGAAKPAIPLQDANGLWRVYWNRLGISKAFVAKLSTSANIKTIVLGATATVTSFGV